MALCGTVPEFQDPVVAIDLMAQEFATIHSMKHVETACITPAAYLWQHVFFSAWHSL